MSVCSSYCNKYHRRGPAGGALINNSSSGSGSPRWAPADEASDALLRATECRLPGGSSHGRRGKGAPWGLLHESTNLLHGRSTLDQSISQRPHLLIPSPWVFVRISTYEFGGETNIQTIAISKNTGLAKSFLQFGEIRPRVKVSLPTTIKATNKPVGGLT